MKWWFSDSCKAPIFLFSDDFWGNRSYLVRLNLLDISITTWKMSVFGVFLVRIFPHLDWIRRGTPYLSVFSPNTGKYTPDKLRIRTFFTQWIPQTLERLTCYGPNKFSHFPKYIWLQTGISSVLLGAY